MEVRIREYKDSDKEKVVEYIEKILDYEVEIDSLKRLRRHPDYGMYHFNRIMEDISKNGGLVLMAEVEGKIVGFMMGVLEMTNKENALMVEPSLYGYSEELYVEPEYRGNGISKMLMERMESFYREKGCKVISLAVFADNINAHELYKRNGFKDRNIYMAKVLD